MAQAADLTGMKILVVEDNFLVADVLCEGLRDIGCEIVGPAPNLERGTKLVDAIGDEHLDGALLDVNLGDGFSFPIAAKLRERGVPFIFLTGYDDRRIVPGEFQTAPRLAKPCNIAQLAAAMRDAF